MEYLIIDAVTKEVISGGTQDFETEIAAMEFEARKFREGLIVHWGHPEGGVVEEAANA